jgi:DNA transposition AAA+ family ATPase
MSGRAFILLKVGCTGPKSMKQVEIRLVDLPTILSIASRNRGSLVRKWSRIARHEDARKDFQDMANSATVGGSVI